MRLFFLAAALFALPPPSSAEFSVAAYAGAARTMDSYVSIDQPGLGTHVRFDGVSFADRSFNSPIYYGYRAGYFWSRHFGAEAEFVHMKVYARVDRTLPASGTVRGEPVDGPVRMADMVQIFSISHGANYLFGNLVARRTFGGDDGPLTFTARLGAGPGIPHPETEVNGFFQEQYELGRPAIQAAAGVEVRLWRGFHGLGEYKFTRGPHRVRIHEGRAETLLRSHHGVFGIGFRWGRRPQSHAIRRQRE